MAVPSHPVSLFASAALAALVLPWIANGPVGGSTQGEPAGVWEWPDGRTEPVSTGGLAGWPRGSGGALGPVALVVSAAPGGGPLPALSNPAEIQLAGGDRLRAEVLGGAGERLAVGLVGGAELALPLEHIRQVRFPERVPAGALLSLTPAQGTDRLYLLVGERLDRVDGTLEGFAAEGVQFDGLAGRRTYPWAEVGAFFVAPLGAEPQRAAGADAVEVDLAGGGRVSGQLLSLDASGLKVRLGAGELALPLVALREVCLLDGRMVHLGALAPASVVGGQPFGDDLGLVFEPRVDRAVHGGPLLAPDGEVARGMGVLAPTVLEWELDGSFERLLGQVAVDRSALRLGSRGSVRFAVEIDGERRFTSGVMSAEDEPVTLPELSLLGAKRLSLVAEDGGDGFAGDRANWLRVRLVRKSRD